MRSCFFAFLFLLCLLFSCNKNDNPSKDDTAQLKETRSSMEEKVRFYYFANSNKKEKNKESVLSIKEVSSIDRVPETEYVPWTESIHVAGIGFLENSPLFILNKVGILSFGLSQYPDFSISSNRLFSMCASAGFYNTDTGLLIRSYNTSVFEYIGDYSGNSTESMKEELPVLSRYNKITREVESIVFPHHFALPSYAVLTSLVHNEQWYASFKIDSGKTVEFRYFTFNNMSDILNGTYVPITAQVFRNASAPINMENKRLEQLPAPFVYLLHNMEEENIIVSYLDRVVASPVEIFRNKKARYDFETAEITAFATSGDVENKNIYSILLSNGKMYTYRNEDKAPVVYFLPKLPENFLYTYFTFYNNVVIAAWEEQAFYERGRAGIVLLPISQLKKS